MYDTLTRQITRRLSQNLRRPLAAASPLGRQLLDGLRGLRAVGPDAAEPAESVESAAAAASASNLAGWGLRNPRAARSLPAGAARKPALRSAGLATPSANPSVLPWAAPSSAATAERLGSHSAGDPLPTPALPVGQRATTATGGCAEASAAALPRPVARAARCTVDPIDTRRTLISGRMSDVCEALDRLIALQAAQSAQGARFAI